MLENQEKDRDITFGNRFLARFGSHFASNDGSKEREEEKRERGGAVELVKWGPNNKTSSVDKGSRAGAPASRAPLYSLGAPMIMAPLD
jgi:hypothetical protein